MFVGISCLQTGWRKVSDTSSISSRCVRSGCGSMELLNLMFIVAKQLKQRIKDEGKESY
jgi:hypothetical protein